MAPTKQPFLEYHFPEINHLPKFPQSQWPVFINELSKSQENLNKQNWVNPNWVTHITWPHWPTQELDVFYDYIDNNYPFIASGEWNNPLNLKIFSDETRYDISTTIPSKNL